MTGPKEVAFILPATEKFCPIVVDLGAEHAGHRVWLHTEQSATVDVDGRITTIKKADRLPSDRDLERFRAHDSSALVNGDGVVSFLALLERPDEIIIEVLGMHWVVATISLRVEDRRSTATPAPLGPHTALPPMLLDDERLEPVPKGAETLRPPPPRPTLVPPIPAHDPDAVTEKPAPERAVGASNDPDDEITEEHLVTRRHFVPALALAATGLTIIGFAALGLWLTTGLTQASVESTDPFFLPPMIPAEVVVANPSVEPETEKDTLPVVKHSAPVLPDPEPPPPEPEPAPEPVPAAAPLPPAPVVVPHLVCKKTSFKEGTDDATDIIFSRCEEIRGSFRCPLEGFNADGTIRYTPAACVKR